MKIEKLTNTDALCEAIEALNDDHSIDKSLDAWIHCGTYQATGEEVVIINFSNSGLLIKA